MPRTLFVHVGPRKTGTSALQQVMREHDNSVVVYPKVGLWDDGSHHGLVFRFRGVERRGTQPMATARTDKTEALEDAGTLFRKVEAEVARSDKDILISSETLRLGSQVEEFVNALRPHVGGPSTKVKLLVTYREHFARAASWYNHRVRAVGETRTPDEFLNNVAESLCYAPLLRDFAKLKFDVTVLAYEPAESTIARILAHIGFPASAMPEAPASRVSLSPKGLLTKLAINNCVADPTRNRECYRRFRKLPGLYARSKFIFGAEAAAKAEGIYRPDREYLRNGFGLDTETTPEERRAAALYVRTEDFEEISTIAREMGRLGARIMEYIVPYVRDSNAAAARL